MIGKILALALWPALVVVSVLATYEQSVLGLLLGVVWVFLIALIGLGPDRLGRWVVIAALLTAPINDKDLRPIPGGPITFSDLLLFVGFVLLIPVLTRRGVHLPLDWALGGLIITISVLMTALLSPDPVVALTWGLRLVAAAVFIPFAFLLWRPERRTLELMAWAYVVGHLLSVAVGLLEMRARWDGLATHPNFFGMAGTTALALLVHKWFTTTGWERHFALVSATVIIGGIYLSGSRAALIVVVLMALIVPFVERTGASAAAVLAGGGTVLVLLQWAVQYAGEDSALGRLMGGGSASGADDERRQALSVGFDKWQQHPVLGAGFDATALDAHNIYLEVAIGIGVVGLAGFLLVLWSGSRNLVTDNPMRRLSYVAVQYAATGMLTNSLWDRFIWTALALSILAVVPAREDPDEERRDAQDSALVPVLPTAR